MNIIQLAVTITADKALARGSVRYGDAIIPLAEADIQCIPPEVRARLSIAPDGAFGVKIGPHVDAFGVTWNDPRVTRPVVDELTVASWLDAVDRLVASETEYAAERAAKLEAAIVAALALPDDKWIQVGYLTREPALRGRQPAGSDADPRVVARIEAVKIGELARRHAAWEAAGAEELAADEAKTAARKARKDAFIAAVRHVSPDLWADYDRAIAEGYRASAAPMVDAVLTTTLAAFVEALPAGANSREGDAHNAEERTSPRAAALDLRAAVATIADAQNAVISPELGQWTVSRVLRADVAAEGQDEKKATIVRAEFAPFAEGVARRSLLVSLEDLTDEDPTDED